MPTAQLENRSILDVPGPESEHFLQNLITTDLDALPAGEAQPGALLSPQGKILFDFLVFQAPEEIGGAYYLDVLKVFAPDLAKRLGFYKLRG